MKPFTAIAISGGVDSFTAAWLLKEQGHRVIGIHFLTGYESSGPPSEGLPNTVIDPAAGKRPRVGGILKPLLPIASELGIAIKVVDLTREFRRIVVHYFAQTYQLGKTPNPCLVCNPKIKFGPLLETAISLGASHLATGHYARLEKDDDGRWHLFRGRDAHKDQSYFLAFLTQDQLARARFPLGDMKKSDVKKMARDRGIDTLFTSESQDVCFIKNSTYGDFLARQDHFSPRPGPIVDCRGRLLGRHDGLHLFTTGQRRGINCPASEPYYVIRLEPEANRLVVGFKPELESSRCRVGDINWLTARPENPIEVYARVRYRHRAAPARLVPMGETSARILFESPQSALTPGQGAVFYDAAGEVLGAGWIQDEP